MTAPVWKRDEIDSPCVDVCVMHRGAKICLGCFRTADEIRRWSGMGQAERDRIRAELPARAPALQKRRGGRAARRADKS